MAETVAQEQVELEVDRVFVETTVKSLLLRIQASSIIRQSLLQEIQRKPLVPVTHIMKRTIALYEELGCPKISSDDQLAFLTQQILDRI
jgi:hypothetical protein